MKRLLAALTLALVCSVALAVSAGARAELSERYGVSFHDERIPEARARLGLEP